MKFKIKFKIKTCYISKNEKIIHLSKRTVTRWKCLTITKEGIVKEMNFVIRCDRLLLEDVRHLN